MILNFAKENLSHVSVVTIEKASHCLALGKIHGFHEFYVRFFAEKQIKNNSSRGNLLLCIRQSGTR